jgi:outer membrane protein
MFINNKFLIGAVGFLFAAVLGLYVIVFTKSDKVAYIDTGKLMEKSKDMIALKQQLQGEMQKIKSNVDTLTAEFEMSLKEYEKNQNKMSAKEKELSRELLKTKQGQLVQYQQAIQQKATQDEQKKTQEVLSRINTYISEYGEQKGYKLIFATTQGNIAYGDKGVDITEDIIAGINK